MKRKLFIHARVSEGEARALNLISLREGVTPSQKMRSLIREAATRAGLPDMGLIILPQHEKNEEE